MGYDGFIAVSLNVRSVTSHALICLSSSLHWYLPMSDFFYFGYHQSFFVHCYAV